MSRVNDESYNSFLRPRWFRIEINWPTQLRWRGMRKFPLSYHGEGITERKCPYVFLQTEPTFQWVSPCDLHIETAWIWRGCIGKKEPLRSSLTSQGCSKKTPKSLPSKQPLDYISPVFYSDYTSVTLFTYIRISSHPTTALISRHYFCRLFCHQETIHLLASRSAIVKPWSWALAGDSNSGSTNLIKKPTGLFNCHGGWWIQQTQRE